MSSRLRFGLPGIGGGLDASATRAAASYDRPLVLTALGLALLGMVMVYSANLPLPSHNAQSPLLSLARGHALYLLIAIVAATAITQVPTEWLARNAGRLFLFGALLLLVVVVLKIVGGGKFLRDGAVRYLPLGPLTVQPAEFMKLFALLYAADYATRRSERLYSFTKGFVPIALALALVSTMLLYQPDLGSTMVIVATVMSVLFLAGMNMRLFIPLIIVLTLFFVAMVIFTPWRLARLLSFISPCDPGVVAAKGYQLCGALIAFGHGALIGSGLGTSIAKLGHLPLPHSDFIFATIGEELGFVGVVSVVIAFMFLTRRAFEIGRQAWILERTFAGLVAQGVGAWIGLQALIHAGVNTGLLPTKGLTLPLISFGGSSLVATALAIGILVRVDIENRRMMRGGFTASVPTDAAQPRRRRLRFGGAAA